MVHGYCNTQNTLWRFNNSIAINISAPDYDGKFDTIYGSKYQLYGELAFNYMKVHVEGNVATFTAIHANDGSIMVQYLTTR